MTLRRNDVSDAARALDARPHCQGERRCRGPRLTLRIRPSASASRSSSGRVGVVPPTSKRATPGWFIPARSKLQDYESRG